MGVLDLARVFIYRFHEKGLEIFLMQNEMESDPDIWNIPEGMSSTIQDRMNAIGKETIDLESKDGGVKTIAIEGDWHDIPSIRGMLKHDIKLAKKVVKSNLPGSEKGTYFAAKECFKKLLPNEYESLKELKDILADRNAIKNM